VNITCDAADVVIIGRVNGAYGIKGWIKLSSYTDPAANIIDYSPWLFTDGDSFRHVSPLQVRRQGAGFVAQLPGVENRDQAAALTGTLIAVNAALLPDAGEDEFYWKDLIGLTVVDQSGDEIGCVTDMLATGANDVLVVECGPDGSQELIPFHRNVVTAVDLEARRLSVDWHFGEIR